MTKKEIMEAAANQEIAMLEGVTLTRSVIRDVFLNGWLAADNHADRNTHEVIKAGLYEEQADAVNVANDAAIERHNEIRDALGTLGEGMAATLQGIKSLREAGLRGADRDVAILKHLQEIGDNVRGVSGAIGDKFGVVLDAVKDVGEKVEACMAIANSTEEGLAVSIEKLDKLGVEKWREAIKHVEAEGTTEPMHAEVKAADYDESGLGKLWADVTVNLEDVSDETLHDLAVSGQISEARYFEEFTRRHGIKQDSRHKEAEALAYAALRAVNAPAFGRYLDAARIAVIQQMDGA